MHFDQSNSSIKPKLKIGRKLKPTDPDFIAPDGGWGWLIVFSCGLSNLSIYPMLQQFGLVFIEKFQQIGISHTQTTIIINIHLALTSWIGLFNGPIYRKFSFRQVAVFGSSLVVTSLLIITWCKSFWSYLIFYGLLFGSSIGLTQSANSLALNTYFKRKRSIATGLSWGITGIGPIVWPYVITLLMNYFGMEGTILLFAGFAGHAIMNSLLLQPVHWHTKSGEKATEVPLMTIHLNSTIMRSNSLPVSLHSFNKLINSKTDSNKSSSKSIKYYLNDRPTLYSQDGLISDTPIRISQNSADENNIRKKSEPKLLKKVITFFDLDILKDSVYLNIIFGMISISFVEVNFTILTPEILKEFNFGKYEIATYMSLLAATDVTVRFSIPFIASRMNWNNRCFYLLGALLTTTGRIVLIHTQKVSTAFFVAILVGFGRGLCVVYLALLIPDHVSLQKLPAAMGIFLTAFGTFFIFMSPVVGWIRDMSQSYVTTIHVLHILIFIATLSWILEYLSKKRKLQAKIDEVLK